MYIFIILLCIHTHIHIYIFYNCLCGSVAKASDTQAVGPLINFIKWVSKYYLEVNLYNCV